MLKLSLVVPLLSLSAFAQDLPFDLGNRVHLGVLFGTSMTSDVRTMHADVSILAASTIPYGTSWKRSGNRQLIVGPSFEYDLGHQFSIEADALYRPVEIETRLVPFNPEVNITLYKTTWQSDIWEFPILAKKYFPLHNWRPFVAAGPSFRAISGFGDSSHYGVTAAAGAEFPWRKLRITPGVRYTHWADAQYGNGGLFQNQSTLLVGFSF